MLCVIHVHLLFVSVCFLLQQFLNGVDPVRLQNAKLQSDDAGSAALNLMDCLVSTEEMVNGNPSGVTRSKDPGRQRTTKQLDQEKMRCSLGVLHDKWGVTTINKDIRRKKTQKCTDYFSVNRYKHLQLIYFLRPYMHIIYM